jgi:hypothetical protein
MGIGHGDGFFAPGSPTWSEDIEYRCPVPGCPTRVMVGYVKISDPPICKKHNELLVEAAHLDEARQGFAERVKAKLPSEDGREKVDKLVAGSSSKADDESRTIEDT